MSAADCAQRALEELRGQLESELNTFLAAVFADGGPALSPPEVYEVSTDNADRKRPCLLVIQGKTTEDHYLTPQINSIVPFTIEVQMHDTDSPAVAESHAGYYRRAVQNCLTKIAQSNVLWADGKVFRLRTSELDTVGGRALTPTGVKYGSGDRNRRRAQVFGRLWVRTTREVA